MYRPVAKSFVLSACLMGSMSVYAAESVDLGNQPVSFLRSYISVPTNLRAAEIKTDQVKEFSRATDSNNTTHIRMQQYHAGVPVWGADSVVHVPNSPKTNGIRFNAVASTPGSSMNGKFYQKLDADLAGTSQQVANEATAAKAKNKAIETVRNDYGPGAEVVEQKLFVYVDAQNKARYAYYISTYLKNAGKNRVAVRPTFLMDAVTFDVIESWNDIRSDAVNYDKEAYSTGGGYGGNKKTGKYAYDGAQGNLAALIIERNKNGTCYMRNGTVNIYDAKSQESSDPNEVTFKCPSQDSKHNNVYWNGSMDPVNGGYSPVNDAIYAGTVVQALYKQWYKLPMLMNPDGSPMLLRMYAHYGDKFENAEWDGRLEEIHLGDGAEDLYPLTSLGVVAHEVSHGFTTQHSDLNYINQSGAMNESFSDMAGMAAEEFSAGKASWNFAADIMKADVSLRYIDQPSKDCQGGNKPGDGCSIDKADQYNQLVNYARTKYRLHGDQLQSYIVHLASGVYNRAFYLMATAQGWDARKAFQVMINANSFYWTKTTTFNDGACGVLKAAKDLKYDTAAVKTAFDKVAIDTSKC